jgi:hypothetical protein
MSVNLSSRPPKKATAYKLTDISDQAKRPKAMLLLDDGEFRTYPSKTQSFARLDAKDGEDYWCRTKAVQCFVAPVIEAIGRVQSVAQAGTTVDAFVFS